VKKARKSPVALIITLAVAALLVVAAIPVTIYVYIYTAESSRPTKEARLITTEDLRSRLGDEVRIDFVYTSAEGWGRETAEYLAGRMDGYDYIVSNVVPDEGYAESESRGDFAVFIGHTLFSEENYLESVLRLGLDGLEISRKTDSSGNTESVTITAFGQETAMRGAERFADFFLSVNRIRNIFTKLYISETSGERLDFVSFRQAEAGEEETVLAVSRPDSNPYTGRLLSAMVDAAAPSEIVVSGGLASEESREKLAEVCSVINGSRGGALWRFCPTSSDPGGSRMNLALEVMRASDPSALSEGSGSTETVYSVVTDESKAPLGVMIYVGVDSLDDSGKTAERIRTLAGVLDRTTDDYPFALILPALPEVCSEAEWFSATGFDPDSELNVLGSRSGQTDGRADEIFTAALESGADLFVCYAGFSNIGTMPIAEGEDAVASLALCGSLGFNNPGIGGKFQLNNALRGGVAVKFVFGESVTAEALTASRFPEIFKND